MQIYNSLTRQKEEFVPRQGKKVNMFVCGPTVYDYSHIGHARTYISFDVIAKYLKYKGYRVKYLQNITDIEDKIIAKAKQENKEPLTLAKEFEKAYYQDVKSLGITSVYKYAPATKYIKQIVSQVKRLKEKGFAYEIPSDGFYFDLKKFPEYGKLSGRTTESAEDAVSRIDESVNKKNKGDFNLWKFSKPGEPKWKTELGEGRPGWHIEDTAITEKHFGEQYDLHGGARDLIFPHHEAEIAQMESISGKKPFVKYWLHTGFLTINGQKMSKSLGNFITIRDTLKKYSAEALRFLVLSTHYRSPIDYREEAIKSSWAGIQRIEEFLRKLSNIRRLEVQLLSGAGEILLETRKEFLEAMDDDFNTPQAIAAIFKMIKELNPLLAENKVDKKSAKKIKKLFEEFNNILGIIPRKTKKTPNEILDMIDTREKLRRDKRYSEADDLRRQISSKGYQIEDTEHGPLVKPR
ncbi:MAG: cysteine--tRNA ligase [Candidatus Yanofskybacteria bacterium]|nr:cysteine--tRNA ligase [Candidatus Yanofskybacteria bacterium]